MPIDERDLAILRAMRVYPFNGTPHGPDALRPAAIAKRTGLGIDLVKDRVGRMERAGIITGYQVYPNLHHFGLREVVLHVDVRLDARDRFFEETNRMEGVAGSSRFVGGSVCVDLMYSSEADLQRKTAALIEWSGYDRQPDRYVQVGAAEPTRPLANLDWRIIKALRGNAKRPYTEIAGDLGVHARTVRRRLERMDEDHAIDVVVEPDLGAISGAVLFVLRISCVPAALDEVLPEVLAVTRQRSFSHMRPATRDGGVFMVDGFVFSQREVDDVRSAVASVAGVEDVELLYPSSATGSGRWLDDAIAAMVTRTSKQTSAAGVGAADEAPLTS